MQLSQEVTRTVKSSPAPVCTQHLMAIHSQEALVCLPHTFFSPYLFPFQHSLSLAVACYLHISDQASEKTSASSLLPQQLNPAGPGDLI